MVKEGNRFIKPGVQILILLILFITTETAISKQCPTGKKNLSVLYFKNNSESKALDWLSKGLADMLISDIARTGTIQVVQRENLQQIINEQKLSMFGIVSEKSAVRIGNIIGADVILTGSYTLVGKTLRIDALLVDVEKGTAIDSVSVQDTYSNILMLEKVLSTKILVMLDIRLTDNEKINFFQLETSSVKAARYNYEAVNAVDNGDLEEAIGLYELAILEDPDYEKPRKNYNRFSEKKINGNLFGVILNERYKKKKGIEIVSILVNKLIDEGFHVEIGELRTENFAVENNRIDVVVPLKLRISYNWIKDFKEVVTLLGGDMPSFNIYKISQDTEINDYFEKLIWKLACEVHLIDKNGETIYTVDASNTIPIYVGYSDFRYCSFDYANKYSEVVFEDIDVDATKRITKIDVKMASFNKGF